MDIRPEFSRPLDRIVDDVLYTSREAAYFLGRSHRTLELWRRLGLGPKVTRVHSRATPRYLGRHLRDVLQGKACFSLGDEE